MKNSAANAPHAPQRWKELPSLDTLEAYIGDRDAAERILGLMRTRAQCDAVTLETRPRSARKARILQPYS